MAARKKERRVTDIELGIRKELATVKGLKQALEGVDLTEEELDEIIAQEARKAAAIQRYLPSILRMSRFVGRKRGKSS